MVEMAEKIEELKKDIAELQTLEAGASRHRVKDVLSLEIRRLTSEVIKLQEELNASYEAAATSTPINTASKRYQVKLNTYAWDQTSKFVKFYVTLQKVHTIPQENVVCSFTNKSLQLSVKDLDNKDYIFVINNLLDQINPAESTWKIKTDMVLISAAKVKSDNWSHVTELEKKVSDSKNAKFKPSDDNMDPGDGLMSIMKNMYETGDDEMKRTIAKAWTESQNKTSPLS